MIRVKIGRDDAGGIWGCEEGREGMTIIRTLMKGPGWTQSQDLKLQMDAITGSQITYLFRAGTGRSLPLLW